MENGGVIGMGEQCCKTCRWYDTEFEICCNGDSEYRADFRLREDTCGKWERHPGLKTNWKREAQEQAAAAGELKILLALHLEELRIQQAALRRHLVLEDSDLDRVIVQWKIGQLQQKIGWLEGVLNGQGSTKDH